MQTLHLWGTPDAFSLSVDVLAEITFPLSGQLALSVLLPPFSKNIFPVTFTGTSLTLSWGVWGS